MHTSALIGSARASALHWPKIFVVGSTGSNDKCSYRVKSGQKGTNLIRHYGAKVVSKLHVCANQNSLGGRYN